MNELVYIYIHARVNINRNPLDSTLHQKTRVASLQSLPSLSNMAAGLCV